MSLGRPHNVSEGRPHSVGREYPLEVITIPYGDVFITSAGEALKTLVGVVLWHYI